MSTLTNIIPLGTLLERLRPLSSALEDRFMRKRGVLENFINVMFVEGEDFTWDHEGRRVLQVAGAKKLAAYLGFGLTYTYRLKQNSLINMKAIISVTPLDPKFIMADGPKITKEALLESSSWKKLSYKELKHTKDRLRDEAIVEVILVVLAQSEVFLETLNVPFPFVMP